MSQTATESAEHSAAPGLDVSSLPPLPDVGMRILRKFGDEFIDGNEVAAVIERDPAICARLIGLANSAYFNLTRPAADMRDIVNRVLGVDTVRSLAFALATQQAFDTSRCPAFDARRYWRSALMTGDSCSRIASVVDDLTEEQRDLAYVFGLCHNLGLLALACVEPERLSGVLARRVDEAEPLNEGIAAEFGFDCAAA
ncbi:MAG: HDOD domain-containing protein, partial [Pseudomonadota bacterium]